jgi:hypothetical protein
MAASNGVFRQLERKAAISQADPERYSAIRQAAESLSRRNADAAVVELFSEAMQRLTLLAYEQDEDGYCNIDPVTHRLLIPAPWGRAGHRRWGLTRTEAEVLRAMLFARQAQTDGRPPGLWLYDRGRRSWRLNVWDFDTLADGQRYWQRWPISVQELRLARGRPSSRNSGQK